MTLSKKEAPPEAEQDKRKEDNLVKKLAIIDRLKNLPNLPKMQQSIQ